MSEDTEQKFGLEGVEQSQGWTPMVSADPVPKEDPGIDLNDPSIKHLSRPEPAEPETREYFGADGEPTPENQSVTPEQAARDLGNIREQERQAKADQDAADLRFALDQLPPDGQQPQQPTQSPEAPQPDEPQLSPDELQLEGLDDDARRAFAESKFAEADQALEEVLKQPLVREKLESEFNAVRTQAAEAVHAVKTHYDAAISQLGQEIGVVTAALITEIAGMNAEQARGALAVVARTNPARMEQINQLASRLQGAVNLTQQHQMQQQQVAQQQAQDQQRRAQEEFQRYAQAEDAKALAKETPESLNQIRSLLYEDGKKAGYSRADIDRAWNSVPALRNSFVSELIADGAKWRLAQRGITRARSNPVPQVQRPGVATSEPRDDSEASHLQGRFNLNPSRELGAALIAARRGRG
jgi:hypothetical protein